MKIMIVGSTTFVKQMVEFRNKLISLGHGVILHEHYVAWGSGKMPKEIKKTIDTKHSRLKRENDYIKVHYQEILQSDAILVLNFDKNGIKNYIGGNTLIEMGQAYVNNKKTFLLNPIPEISYKAEIEAMDPIILNNDLSVIC